MNNFLFIFAFCLAEGYLNNGLLSISITRHHKGDIFIAQAKPKQEWQHNGMQGVYTCHQQSSTTVTDETVGVDEEEKCYRDFCVNLSGGTAIGTGNGECECKCTPNRPVFRDDVNTCVDDIQECSLVRFASSSVIKKIPYVFLPLKGQIVYPSADIIISDVETPVCVVSGGQFLGQNGWLPLRNNSEEETPFRLFRDEGRTYLQWLGEPSLRMAMEGRIILVRLMCKDARVTEEPKIFTPCIAFRVAGNPNVKEMMFIKDVHLKEEYGGGLNVREYVAIGTCSLLLAIVYVAAIFLYLHIRKRKHKKGTKKTEEDAQLTLGEEGVIKSNPLLQATKHLSVGGQDNAGYISESNSCCSDTDQTSDLLCLDDEDLMGPQNMQISAIIHPCNLDYGESNINQDSNNIEKLPEENVSIVETLEIKDEHLETIKAMGCANGRRKLYFNPSYFEPDLMKAPPPAAMEFLIKIREVIAIAKHKMSTKKFSPSLGGIPEEDGSLKADFSSSLGTPKNPPKIEKCEAKNTSRLEKTLGDNFHILPNEIGSPLDTKQKIIRKWLEDVPVMIFQSDERTPQKVISQEKKILSKSKLWQMNHENQTKQNNEMPTSPTRQEKKKTKGRAPPIPQLKTELQEESKTEKRDSSSDVCSANTKIESVVPPRPPPMPSFKSNCDEIPRVQGKDCVPPAIAKNLMDAVIQELSSYKKNDKNLKLKELPGRINDVIKENADDPTADFPERQTETTHSVSEEIIKIDDGFSDMKNTREDAPQDDHEYEIILLNGDTSEGKDLKIYNLPEILSKSEGYSLVSEVYVNDGYSCCSGESPSSTYSNMSAESDKIHYETPNEKSGRLTIHVNDSPERYKTSASESDNFEPDTLDRKPRKSKLLKKLNEETERYSNQKFHDMECCINSNKSECFMDSLERPSIMLKTNGTFKRNALDQEIDHLFRNFHWKKVEGVGSLREIYEAKSRSHRKRSETTSLIGMDNVCRDHDSHSTLSWSEEKRNKLLHRGIILHIKEDKSRKHKRIAKCGSHVVNPSKMASRSPKLCPNPRSRSTSPVIRSNCTTPSSGIPISPRSISPPLPPPRSMPSSPPPKLMTISPPPKSTCLLPPQIPPRSTNNSPVSTDRQKGCKSPSYTSPSNSIPRSLKNLSIPPSCSSPVLQLSPTTPPPRPPKTINSSPFLPPRNTKPPLPPKNIKKHPKPGKFAGRPLPPLPRTSKDHSSSPVPYKDPETLSILSGASMDSLNSSDYEAFYTLPYEEEEMGSSSKEDFVKSKHASSNAITIDRLSTSSVSNSGKWAINQRSRHSERRSLKGLNKTIPHRPEDSGYLSTDSDSCCPQLIFPAQFSKIPENGYQNSETEESLCDGASESGGESIATDSFFYGNFRKKSPKTSEDGTGTDIYPYSLRLSDVEVNSDTERHCVPIMVMP